jgi:hypothetical protein
MHLGFHTIQNVNNKRITRLSTFNSNGTTQIVDRSQIDILDVVGIYDDKRREAYDDDW